MSEQADFYAKGTLVVIVLTSGVRLIGLLIEHNEHCTDLGFPAVLEGDDFAIGLKDYPLRCSSVHIHGDMQIVFEDDMPREYALHVNDMYEAYVRSKADRFEDKELEPLITTRMAKIGQA